MPTFRPDAAQTLAYAAVVLLAGLLLKKKINVLDRLSIPAPVAALYMLLESLRRTIPLTDHQPAHRSVDHTPRGF